MIKKKFFIPLLSLLLVGCEFNIFAKNSSNNTDPQQQQQTEMKNEEQNDNNEQKDQDNNAVHVSSVLLNKKIISLEESETDQLTATVLPENATNKKVNWTSSNNTIAFVENGLVRALNEGSAIITATSEDGSKTDTCNVTVSKKESQTEIISSSVTFNDLGYTKDNNNYVDPIEIAKNITVTFAKTNETQTAPACIKGSNTKKYEARAYAGNSITISSSKDDLTKIVFTYSTDDPNNNEISSNCGSFDGTEWIGKSKDIIFTVGGTSKHRRIASISVFYAGKTEENPDEVLNLGEMTIAEVKDYITENPVTKNAFGNGVNEKRYVTIKGLAVARIDTVKTKSSYGLDVTEAAKVILADETGYIGAASKTNEGSLWYKVGDNVCKQDSKYYVTGYISEIQGNPEIKIISYTWDKTLKINVDFDALSKSTMTLEQFYKDANNINYNCAGHGYGDVHTINNLLCYFIEADGQGKRYYNFTDGTKNIRVNAYNLGSVSEGLIYNVTGITSLKNLSPIILAFNIELTENPVDIEFQYDTISQNITITGLKNIHGSQDDTSTKYPDVINAYGTFYKTTGYLTAVEENGKFYVGISDSFIDRKYIITGKTNAMANYGISLIKNDNFWNTTENELYLFNPTYDEYLFEDTPITIYFVTRQLSYSSNKAMWEILLIPQFIESLNTK